MLTKKQVDGLVKHLRDMATLLESAGAEAPVTKRGRKPGAVSDDVRCQETSASGDRCKNRATGGTFCKKHTKS